MLAYRNSIHRSASECEIDAGIQLTRKGASGLLAACIRTSRIRRFIFSGLAADAVPVTRATTTLLRAKQYIICSKMHKHTVSRSCLFR